MTSNHTARASTDDGRRLYEQRNTGGPSWTVDTEPEPTEVTFGAGGDTTSSGGTIAAGEDLYRRRHGGNGGR